MSIYATVIGTIAGICLGYAILYLFVGLRRSADKRLNLSFALFALGYAHSHPDLHRDAGADY